MAGVINLKDVSKDYIVIDHNLPVYKRWMNSHRKMIQAVKDFDLEIVAGEVVALLGKNGAGKSTLIKMLTGILMPTKGYMECLDMNPIYNHYNYTQNIGVVMGQKSLLWPHIPVETSFKLYKDIYLLSDDDYNSRIEVFDDMLSIRKYLKTPVRQLSLGERMRCEFVAAVLHNPKLLFLDEPTIGLDISSKRSIHQFIREMNRQYGTTIILTSHDLEDSRTLCNRVVIIDDGSKVYDGRMRDLEVKSGRTRIAVKGSIDIQSELKKYLISQNEGDYVFECSKEELNLFKDKLFCAESIDSFEIQDISLETLVSKLYQKE